MLHTINVIFKLLTIYNHIWTNHIFPTTWRKNLFSINSYKPISLTSHLCKLFEKIVHQDLLWVLENENLLTSTRIFITYHINKALQHKNHLLATFFNITKAFDTIRKYNFKNSSQLEHS